MNNIFVNGQAQENVSVLDRGLLYGDSLFETIALIDGFALMMDAHLSRLKKGIFKLGFNVDISTLKQELSLFIKQIDLSKNNKNVLRITLTRSAQSRGYQPIAGTPATRILSIHDWPEYEQRLYDSGVRMGLSQIKYAQQPFLAGIKHGNRLEQVLAAQSISHDQDDVLMLDTKEHVISSGKGNLFFLFNDEWFTPNLSLCGIDGIVRATILEFFSNTGVAYRIDNLHLAELSDKKKEIKAAFCCNSIMGIMPIQTLLGEHVDSAGDENIKQAEVLRNALIHSKVIAS